MFRVRRRRRAGPAGPRLRTVRPSGLEHTVSAKLYDACAIGRSVIVACRGELRRIVAEGIALAVPHSDPEALAEAVRRVRTDSELGARLTESARAFARRHLRERQAERLAELIESLADRS